MQGAFKFSKMEGCGNSFVVTDEIENPARDWQKLAALLCDAHFGVGSDGLMVVRKGQGVDFEVLMYNPDGSLMGMCGNGIRCVSRYVAIKGYIPQKQTDLSFSVEGRLIKCTLIPNGDLVKVDLASPAFSPQEIPLQSENEMIAASLTVAGKKFPFTALSLGNPHCVIFVSDRPEDRENNLFLHCSFDNINLSEVGPLIEQHPLFPRRTNVEFVERRDSKHLRVKVWERGAGVTLACGTGACASVVAAARNAICDCDCTVELPGGELRVLWDKTLNRVFLTGPAKLICDGIFLK